MPLDPLSPLSGLHSPASPQSRKPAAAAGSADFATVLTDLARQTASALKASEDTAIKGIQGQAPLQDVVQSVMRAQTSLQTALALRDKTVSAYQDLVRMTI